MKKAIHFLWNWDLKMRSKYSLFVAKGHLKGVEMLGFYARTMTRTECRYTDLWNIFPLPNNTVEGPQNACFLYFEQKFRPYRLDILGQKNTLLPLATLCCYILVRKPKGQLRFERSETIIQSDWKFNMRSTGHKCHTCRDASKILELGLIEGRMLRTRARKL